MLVRLENPGLLSRVIEIISELVTEVRIKVNEFGLSITAMDPANVALDWYKNKYPEEEEKKERKEFNFKPIRLTELSEKYLSPAIKKIL